MLATDAFALHIDYGRWVDGGKANVLAVHAALLPTGNILFWGGSQNDPKRRLGLDNYRLYNTDTGEITKVSGPSIDHFCSGHSVGGNGGLVVAGGTEFYGKDDETWIDDLKNHKAMGHFTGPSEVWFYDAFTPAWNRNATLMNQGRWYPSLIGVNDYYDMIALSGHPGNNDVPHRNDDVRLG